MLFISPPFGNYIQLPNTMSIKGSYTLEPRPGLILQILKTLRLVKYNDTYSWINKIGLRNPGCLLYTSPSPRDQRGSRMPSSA